MRENCLCGTEQLKQRRQMCTLLCRSQFGLKSDNFLTENIMTMHNFDCSQKCCEAFGGSTIILHTRKQMGFNLNYTWHACRQPSLLLALQFKHQCLQAFMVLFRWCLLDQKFLSKLRSFWNFFGRWCLDIDSSI